MPKLRIDGIDFHAPDGWTILETANYLGLEIPTLCYHEGLITLGRLPALYCGDHAAKKPKLVTSCTYPVEEGLIVRTNTEKVNKGAENDTGAADLPVPHIEGIAGSCLQNGTQQSTVHSQMGKLHLLRIMCQDVQ